MSKLYQNHKVYSPSGILMFRSSFKTTKRIQESDGRISINKIDIENGDDTINVNPSCSNEIKIS